MSRGGRCGSGRSATATAPSSLIAGCGRAVAGGSRGQDALSGKTLVGRVREGGGVVDGWGLRDARRVLVVSEVRLQLILNRKPGSVS